MGNQFPCDRVGIQNRKSDSFSAHFEHKFGTVLIVFRYELKGRYFLESLEDREDERICQVFVGLRNAFLECKCPAETFRHYTENGNGSLSVNFAVF